MLSFLAAGLLLLQVVAADNTCVSGYDVDANGNCISLKYSTVDRNTASRACANEGAVLVPIPNAFSNTRLQSYGQRVEAFWLGITCLGNDKTTCVNDDGTNFTSSTFDNFYGFRPDVDAGACVVMLTANGRWYSADCASARDAYVCSYNPNSRPVTCTQDSTQFHGNCYFPIDTTSIQAAKARCQQNCGDIASIHALGENSFVRGLGSSYDTKQIYLLTGLQLNGSSYQWTDKSSYNYYNYGYQNSALGSCVSMALQDDAIPKGKWINSGCTASNIVTVCKKSMTNHCDTTTVRPTLSPTVCSSTMYYSNAGTFYSPGYPLPSIANTCEYVISENAGLPYISFSSVKLDYNSHIQIFDNFLDPKPSVDLYSTSFGERTFYGNSSVMKVRFITNGGSGNFWQANFGLQVSTTPIQPTRGYCNGGELSNYGNFTSPHYPNNYDSYVDCPYYLRSNQNRVDLRFNDFSLASEDKLTVFDGYGYNNRVLATLQGTATNFARNYTSTGEYLTLRFQTQANVARGWQASFWSTK